MASILIVDPKEGRQSIFREAIKPHQGTLCTTADDALKALAEERFHIIFCWYGDDKEAELLCKVREQEHKTFFIDIVEDEAAAAAAAMPRKRAGKKEAKPDSFIGSSFTVGDVDEEIRKAAKALGIAGETAKADIRDLKKLAARVAENDRPVLIYGEPGTGKRTLARHIHALSRRGKAGGPCKVFPCADLDAREMESELFGHEKGAFPWAVNENPGLLRQSTRGTVVLAGINRLGKEVQRKLSILLEDPLCRYTRLGGQEAISADIRLIATSEEPLPQKLEDSSCRDLFSLLAQNYIEVAPLRSRTEELQTLLARFNPKGIKISADALEVLRTYPWPRNLEELKFAMDWALLKTERLVEVHHLPDYLVNAAWRMPRV